MEAALLLGLALSGARLVWVLVTPTGPFGDWRPAAPAMISGPARQALFAAFDPFFRGGNAAPGQAVQQVTALPLQLYGIRVNEATGLGSAIIANDAGEQRAYAVGEEIAPGVTLKAVDYDHVVIARGGVSENLYIDQSGSAPLVAGGAGDTAAAAATATNAPAPLLAAAPLSPETLLAGIDFMPRNQGGRVTGLVVSGGDPQTFARAGFQSGDIIAQINGRPISSAADITDLQNNLKPGARISLMVERGAATVPIAIIIPDKK